MIVRMWRTAIDPAHRREFEHIEEEHLARLLEKQSGFGGVLFLARDDEATVLTLWESRDAADAFNGSVAAQQLTEEVRAKGFFHGEPRVEVFEVIGGSFNTHA
ncbi:MAG: hypothetical protein NVS9B15_20070 [Acidobacteriaceae bacterium]